MNFTINDSNCNYFIETCPKCAGRICVGSCVCDGCGTDYSKEYISHLDREIEMWNYFLVFLAIAAVLAVGVSFWR